MIDGGPRILIIDDDEVNLELLKLELELDNYRVTAAHGGTVGLAEALRDTPDLVITDLLMPDLDGHQIVRQLKANARTCAVPILLVTSINEREERLRGLAAGADEFLSRPIDSAELLTRVRSLIRSKALYDRLQAANVELEQRVAERTAQLSATVRELEAFCYSVSHDLRAPLRGMKGFARAVLEDYADRLDAGAVEHLERVCAASTQMDQMIDDLLTLSQLSQRDLRYRRTDLTALAQSLVEEFRDAEPRRTIDVFIQPRLVGYCDQGLLRLVYQNLLQNAWKFTRGKTHARIEVGAIDEADMPAYYVRDNGAGFDMAYAHRLFGAFGRLHDNREFEGHGIGLATVQRIVHRHGGQVWAESAVDVGSTFWFTLGVDRPPTLGKQGVGQHA